VALDDRKARVLRAVVEEHIETGLPVGSRVIARRYSLGVSPATIRNEMADLEDTGYLDKPHTSSGRVPSDRGYRLYVDELMPERGLSQDEIASLEVLFRSKAKDVVSVLKETVKAISETTNYLGFVLGPDSGSVTYTGVHLLPASVGKALLVIITDVGVVDTCLIEVPPMPDDEIRRVSDMLSRYLSNVELSRVPDRAHLMLHEEASRYSEIVDQVVECLRSLQAMPEGERLMVSGAVNLLSQPEFRDVDRVRHLFSAIESEGLIQYLLERRSQTESPAISIGAENESSAVKDLSMVYGRFSAGRIEGTVGLLGPKRMDYSKAVAIVRFLESRLSRYLSRLQ
jgi:heat-inducible transcriptional repressor